MNLFFIFAIAFGGFRVGAAQLKPACELQLVAVPKSRRQVLVESPNLPYFNGRVVIEKVRLDDGSVAYAVVTAGGDTLKFSISGLFDFWLNELIYKHELNAGLKVKTVLYGHIIPGLPRRIPLVTVNPKFISSADAETFMRGFLVSVAELNLVTYNWKLELSSIDLVKFLRGFPSTENYLDRELVGVWTNRFNNLYADLPVTDRLLLSRNFFNPQRSLYPDDHLLRNYVYQGNLREEEAALERLRRKLANLFSPLTPLTIDDSYSLPRHGGIQPAVDTSLRLTDGTRLGDARNIQFDPRVNVADLDLSEELYERLNSAGFMVPEQFMFYDAKRLVHDLNLNRAELLELAQTLFNENIFLKFDRFWDLKGWRILTDHTYLRTPRRTIPKTKRDLVPVSRDAKDD